MDVLESSFFRVTRDADLAVSDEADDLLELGDVAPHGRILGGGVAILAEVQQRLGAPLHVCDGGIREGAALALRSALAA